MTSETRPRVFVVEDEMTIAMLIEEMLEELGYEIAGTSMRLETGLQLAQSVEADLAILDINLDGKQSFPIADVLKRRGIPFFFATGYGTKGLNARYADTLTLKKPFLFRDLETAVRQAVN